MIRDVEVYEAVVASVDNDGSVMKREYVTLVAEGWDEVEEWESEKGYRRIETVEPVHGDKVVDLGGGDDSDGE